MELEPGDIVRLKVGGGGGWGDPALRSSESMARDIADGRLTAAHAIDAYGYDPV